MSRCLADRSIDHVVLERGEVAHSWRTAAVGLAAVATQLDDPATGLRLPRRRPRRLPRRLRRRGAHRGIREGERGAGAGEHHGDIGAADRARVRGADRPGLLARPVGRARRGRQHRCQSAGAASQCPPGSQRSPRRTTATRRGSRRRGPRRRRLGERDPDRRGAAPLRPAGHAGRRSTRMPRTYRGKDILWWMDAAGLLDERYDQIPDRPGPQPAVDAADRFTDRTPSTSTR